MGRSNHGKDCVGDDLRTHPVRWLGDSYQVSPTGRLKFQNGAIYPIRDAIRLSRESRETVKAIHLCMTHFDGELLPESPKQKEKPRIIIRGARTFDGRET